MRTLLFLLALITGSVSAMPPIEDYKQLEIFGWKVFISPNVTAQPKLERRIIKQVAADLARVIEVVPASSVDYLKSTSIWLEEGMPIKQLNHLFFNGSKKLTKQYGMVPQSYGGVIAGRATEYLAMAKLQPNQLLHELTHGFHQFDLRHNYAPIKNAFEQAKAKQIYSKNQDTHMPVKVYAMKNHKEYLSELTVVYFAGHRKFPHNREQLAKVDPIGYCAVVKAWGLVGQQPNNPPLLCN